MVCLWKQCGTHPLRTTSHVSGKQGSVVKSLPPSSTLGCRRKRLETKSEIGLLNFCRQSLPMTPVTPATSGEAVTLADVTKKHSNLNFRTSMPISALEAPCRPASSCALSHIHLFFLLDPCRFVLDSKF